MGTCTSCNGTVLGCGAGGQERMVASLNLFWDEECQYLKELGKDVGRFLFLLSKGAEAKGKTLALDRGEGRNVLC